MKTYTEAQIESALRFMVGCMNNGIVTLGWEEVVAAFRQGLERASRGEVL